MPTHPEIMSLNALILALQKRPPDQPVYLDFCDCVASGLRSWRGIYAELAIGWSEPGAKPETVKQWIDRLTRAIDSDFGGYKGSSYTMNRHTPIHVDNWGECSGTGVVGVRGNDLRTVLITATVED